MSLKRRLRYPLLIGLAGALTVVVALMWGAVALPVGSQSATQTPSGAALTAVSQPTTSLPTARGRAIGYALSNREVTAFDEGTGAVLHRFTTQDDPDILVTPAGDQLFLLDTKWSSDGKTPSHRLSLLDTASWRVLGQVTIADRILYPGPGPSGLTLAPDGSRLFIYSYHVLGDDRADYWLAAVDAKSLQLLPIHAALDQCGAARFTTLAQQIVALCAHANDLRFVDPVTGSVGATVALPPLAPLSVEGQVAGLTTTPDKRTIYIVTNDLRIVEVDATTRTQVREVTAARQAPQSVPLDVVTVSSDGRSLLVGTLTAPRGQAAGVTLKQFALPDLTPSASIPLPINASVVGAVGGKIYLSDGTALRVFDPERRQTTATVSLNGRTQRVVP